MDTYENIERGLLEFLDQYFDKQNPADIWPTSLGIRAFEPEVEPPFVKHDQVNQLHAFSDSRYLSPSVIKLSKPRELPFAQTAPLPLRLATRTIPYNIPENDLSSPNVPGHDFRFAYPTSDHTFYQAWSTSTPLPSAGGTASPSQLTGTPSPVPSCSPLQPYQNVTSPSPTSSVNFAEPTTLQSSSTTTLHEPVSSAQISCHSELSATIPLLQCPNSRGGISVMEGSDAVYGGGIQPFLWPASALLYPTSLGARKGGEPTAPVMDHLPYPPPIFGQDAPILPLSIEGTGVSRIDGHGTKRRNSASSSSSSFGTEGSLYAASSPSNSSSSSAAASPSGSSSPSSTTPKPASQVLKNLLDPKAVPKLACTFCRERRIACRSPVVGEQCDQCFKRRRACAYPKKSKRGVRPFKADELDKPGKVKKVYFV